MILLENETTHVAQTVDGRISSRHDAGVGRQGQRHLRGGMGETNSPRGQRVQVRRLGAARTVTAQMVRARSINCNQNDIGITRTLDSGSLNSL